MTRIDDANHPLVIAIGNAEGTRTPSGGRTAHHYGHTDPGNGVRNQGSFSAQQGYASPAAADAAWIRRLNAELPGWSRALAKLAPPGSVGHTRMLASAADLSVQAPAAVPDFIKHVAQAKATGFSWDAIAEARAKSYINPRTGRLEAAGFGNHFPSLLQDQRRRVRQLAQVLER